MSWIAPAVSRMKNKLSVRSSGKAPSVKMGKPKKMGSQKKRASSAPFMTKLLKGK